MQLSEHFSLAELTASDTAVRLGIDNTAPAAVVERLKHTAAGMEKVRQLFGGLPIHVNSGYRCPALNKALHGAANSAHVDGNAIDFTCAAFGPPEKIVAALQTSGIAFDQVIQEGTWVHISFAPAMRQEILRAIFGWGGKVTYLPWSGQGGK